jgi:(S)-ureidoglycine aminohydrolase
MFHHLGATRSSLKADHLLQTPDTFIRTPLPGADGVDFIIHAGARLGADFTMMTAEFREGGHLADPAPTLQRFVFVLDGELDVTADDAAKTLRTNGFYFFPSETVHRVQARTAARAVLIEKPYKTLPGTAAPSACFGQEQNLPSEALGGDPGLQVKRMMPDGPAYDFAVNTMTYDPGASLAVVEVHVMEHGLLMLEGGGIYRLGDSWYPVAAGDFIWMAPYCPQWFGALGKVPAKYLIYKDWYRHPLAE